MNRRQFLKSALMATSAVALSPFANAVASQFERRKSDFAFTRLAYASGNWNTDERMPSNVLHSLVQYTTISIESKEKIIALDSPEIFDSPFCYLSGHKLVELTSKERENFERYVRNGGFIFVDDCNHDIDGLFAKSFEAQVARIFGERSLKKVPNSHPIYRAFFDFPNGPPTTSLELNGWGDDLVHDYLKAVEINGRIGLLYSNKDYGCEWDYDHRNKRWLAEDNTKFAVNLVLFALTQ